MSSRRRGRCGHVDQSCLSRHAANRFAGAGNCQIGAATSNRRLGKIEPMSAAESFDIRQPQGRLGPAGLKARVLRGSGLPQMAEAGCGPTSPTIRSLSAISMRRSADTFGMVFALFLAHQTAQSGWRRWSIDGHHTVSSSLVPSGLRASPAKRQLGLAPPPQKHQTSRALLGLGTSRGKCASASSNRPIRFGIIPRRADRAPAIAG